MTANAFHDISKIEDSLWEAADQLRANSKLTSSEYCMPVLGVIFLRHATNRFDAALKAIEADQAAGRMPPRPLGGDDVLRLANERPRRPWEAMDSGVPRTAEDDGKLAAFVRDIRASDRLKGSVKEKGPSRVRFARLYKAAACP